MITYGASGYPLSDARDAIRRDAWALGQVEPAAAAIRDWDRARFKREPQGPEDLRVLRDWLSDHDVEIDPLHLAFVVKHWSSL